MNALATLPEMPQETPATPGPLSLPSPDVSNAGRPLHVVARGISVPGSDSGERLFAANTIARALGLTSKAVREALKGKEAGQVSGQGGRAHAYRWTDLPETWIEALTAKARAEGLPDVPSLLTEGSGYWQPPVDPDDLEKRFSKQADDSRRRMRALAPALERLIQGAKATARERRNAMQNWKAADWFLPMARAGWESVFGATPDNRTLETWVDRVIYRDGGRGEFQSWELYIEDRNYSAQPARATTRKAVPVEGFHRILDGYPTGSTMSDNERALCLHDLFLHVEELAADDSREMEAVAALAKVLVDRHHQLAGRNRAREHSVDPTRKALKRDIKTWRDADRKAAALLDRRKEDSGNFRLPPFEAPEWKREMDLLRQQAILRMGDLAFAFRVLWKNGELPVIGQHYSINPRNPETPRAVEKYLLPQIRAAVSFARGPHIGRKASASIRRCWDDVHAGDGWTADDVTLDFDARQLVNGEEKVFRPEALFLVDEKSGYVLAFLILGARDGEGHRGIRYTAQDVSKLIKIGVQRYGLPRRRFAFENGAWKSRAVLGQNGSDQCGDLPSWGDLRMQMDRFGCPIEALGETDEVDAPTGLSAAGVRVTHALPGNARSKVAETFFNTMHRHTTHLPGYVGRDEKTQGHERNKRIVEMCKSGKLDPRRYLMSIDQVATFLDGVIQEYNRTPQPGSDRLKGMSPAELWDRDVTNNPAGRLRELSEEELMMLGTVKHEGLRVTSKGISVRIAGRPMPYVIRDEMDRWIGHRVDVYRDMDHPKVVLVVDPNTGAKTRAEQHSIPAMATGKQIQEAERRGGQSAQPIKEWALDAEAQRYRTIANGNTCKGRADGDGLPEHQAEIASELIASRQRTEAEQDRQQKVSAKAKAEIRRAGLDPANVAAPREFVEAHSELLNLDE